MKNPSSILTGCRGAASVGARGPERHRQIERLVVPRGSGSEVPCFQRSRSLLRALTIFAALFLAPGVAKTTPRPIFRCFTHTIYVTDAYNTCWKHCVQCYRISYGPDGQEEYEDISLECQEEVCEPRVY